MSSPTDWTRRYHASLMDTFGTPKATLVRGAGAVVWDIDGTAYVDLLGGIAVNSLGHAHPRLVAAVTEQLATLGHVSNFFASEAQVALAERLRDLLGRPSKVFFSNSGTEANEAAFKIARRTGRTRMVVAEGSFHGRTMGSLALTSQAAYREPFEPLPGEVTWVPYGDARALESAMDDTVAAVVLEPVQGEAGVVVPGVGYLAEAGEIAHRHGALLWLDEVQTGIGRCGAWFAHQLPFAGGVSPDVVTLAKGLGGGIPIGATIATGPAAELLRPGNHGSTFGGNPVACAAALAVIDTIADEGLLDAAAQHGKELRDGLAQDPRVVEARGHGLLIGLELVTDSSADVAAAALETGWIINNPTPSGIRLAPPLVLSTDQVAGFMAAFPSILDAAAVEAPDDPGGHT